MANIKLLNTGISKDSLNAIERNSKKLEELASVLERNSKVENDVSGKEVALALKEIKDALDTRDSRLLSLILNLNEQFISINKALGTSYEALPEAVNPLEIPIKNASVLSTNLKKIVSILESSGMTSTDQLAVDKFASSQNDLYLPPIAGKAPVESDEIKQKNVSSENEEKEEKKEEKHKWNFTKSTFSKITGVMSDMWNHMKTAAIVTATTLVASLFSAEGRKSWKLIFESLGLLIKVGVKEVFGIKNGEGSFWAQLSRTIILGLWDMMAWIDKAISTANGWLWSKLWYGFSMTSADMLKSFSKLDVNVYKGFTFVVNKLKEGFNWLGDSILNLGASLGTWLKDLGGDIVSGLGGYFTTLWSNFKVSLVEVGLNLKLMGKQIVDALTLGTSDKEKKEQEAMKAANEAKIQKMKADAQAEAKAEQAKRAEADAKRNAKIEEEKRGNSASAERRKVERAKKAQTYSAQRDAGAAEIEQKFEAKDEELREDAKQESVAIQEFVGGGWRQDALKTVRDKYIAPTLDEWVAGTKEEGDSKVDKRDLSKYADTKGVNVSGLDPEFASKFTAAAKEFYDTHGRKLKITAGKRTDKEQAELWVRYNIYKEKGIYMPARPINDTTVTVHGKQHFVKGSRSSKPGHLTGQAIDVSVASGDASAFSAIASRHGIIRPWSKKDPPHFQEATKVGAPEGGQVEGLAMRQAQPADKPNLAQLQAFKSETVTEGTAVSDIHTPPMSVAENASVSEEKQTTNQVSNPTILANNSPTFFNTGENPNSKRT